MILNIIFYLITQENYNSKKIKIYKLFLCISLHTQSWMYLDFKLLTHLNKNYFYFNFIREDLHKNIIMEKNYCLKKKKKASPRAKAPAQLNLNNLFSKKNEIVRGHTFRWLIEIAPQLKNVTEFVSWFYSAWSYRAQNSCSKLFSNNVNQFKEKKPMQKEC